MGRRGGGAGMYLPGCQQVFLKSVRVDGPKPLVKPSGRCLSADYPEHCRGQAKNLDSHKMDGVSASGVIPSNGFSERSPGPAVRLGRRPGQEGRRHLIRQR